MSNAEMILLDTTMGQVALDPVLISSMRDGDEPGTTEIDADDDRWCIAKIGLREVTAMVNAARRQARVNG